MDGKTAYERLKGKRAKMNGIEFGEGVMFKRNPKDGQLGKLSILWDDGIFQGVKTLSGEMIVGTKNGV